MVGTLGVSFNNFSIKNVPKKNTWTPLPSGDGQKLSIRFQSNGRYFQSYNMSFTEPWLGGKKPNSLTVSAFRSVQSDGLKLSDPNRSDLTISGGALGLGRRLKWPDDYFNLIYSLNFQQYKLKNYNQIFSGFNNGNSTNISLKLTLLRNSAGPNPIFPTSGSNFSLSGQFTLPYSLLGINSGTTNKFELPEFHKWRFTGD